MVVLGGAVLSYERGNPVFAGGGMRVVHGVAGPLDVERNPRHETGTLRPETRDTRHETRNPRPETRNPKPVT